MRNIPETFSDDQSQESQDQTDDKEEISSEQLFDKDSSEDDDFEIPAFLRRQKF